MADGGCVSLMSSDSSSSRTALNDYSPFTIHHSRSSSSAFRAAQGCVEEAGGVEDEDARAVVFEGAAQGRVCGVGRGDVVNVNTDDACVALGGERQLFVAAQRDDEKRRRVARVRVPSLFVVADESERV